MKLRSIICFSICINVMSANVFAQKLPADFIFENKPIDPQCFVETQSHTAVTDLRKCGIKVNKNQKLLEKNKEMLNRGFVGYDFSTHEDSYTSHESSYYKVVGKLDNKYVVYTMNNTGGTGNFTGLSLVERKNNKLHISTFEGGDRCNGGITDAKIENNILKFERNITPFDLLEIVNSNPKKLKAYDDLTACAICCGGIAKYSSTSSSINKPTLSSVELPNINWKTEGNTQGIYQECFNKVTDTFILKHTRNTLEYTPAEIKELVDLFNAQCVVNE